MSGSPEHIVFMGMRERCRNPKAETFKYYGAKGTKVCAGWMGDAGFSDFFAKIGARPSKRHSVDRIESSGHYSCGTCDECVANGWTMNVRWATEVVQQNNRGNNRRLEMNGEIKTLAEWSRETGIGAATIANRLKKVASLEEAIAMGKPRAKHAPVEINGESMSIKDWAKRLGIPYHVVIGRIVAGISREDAITAPIGARFVRSSS